VSNAIVATSNLWVGGQTTLSNNVLVWGPAAASNGFAVSKDLQVAGFLAVGTDTATYPIHVSTHANNVSIYASYDITAFSDLRVKTDMTVISDALAKIDRIGGYTYRRIDDHSTNSRRHCGLIAQEVSDVLPEAVHIHPSTGMMSVAYGNVVSLLVEAIKELAQKVDVQQEQLAKIETILCDSGLGLQ
jgi:PKD repeat protein